MSISIYFFELLNSLKHELLSLSLQEPAPKKNISKEGFLLKLSSGVRHDWKRRYFMLYESGELVYFRPSSKISRKKTSLHNRSNSGDSFEVRLKRRIIDP